MLALADEYKDPSRWQRVVAAEVVSCVVELSLGARNKSMALPNPIIAPPGHPPQAGQWAPYQYEDGSLTSCLIVQVSGLGHSPDGKRYNVLAVKLPESGPGFAYGEWQFDVPSGRVLYIPSGPPY
jgi:hypothetical protein